MAQCVLLRRADGGVSIVYPVGVVLIEELIEKWERTASASWLPLVGWRIADSDDLPTDRSDRDAWSDDGATVAVDPARKAAIAAKKLADEQAEAKRLRALLADR